MADNWHNGKLMLDADDKPLFTNEELREAVHAAIVRGDVEVGDRVQVLYITTFKGGEQEHDDG